MIKKLYKKYEEIINYIIVGVLTTIVSLGSKYALLFTILDASNAFQLQVSIIVSWILAVTFAYIMNRKYVFKSKSKNYLYEILSFYGGRVLTLTMEMVIMWFFITFLELNTNLWVIIVTFICQFLILIFNYIISKFFVFRNDEKKKNKNSTSKLNLVLYGIILIMFLLICYFIPYSHDDWAWGTSIGIDRLNSGFANYNGRYFSNILILLITRNQIAKAIFMFLISISIIKVSSKLINDKFSSYFLTILLLLMPYTNIAQGFSWASGFVNYTFPIILILIYIYMNKDLFKNNPVKISNKWIFPMFILGIFSALIVENVTIYFVIIALFINIYSYIKNKKINFSNISYLFGIIIGAIIMFKNGAYHNVMIGKDSYRSIESANIIVRSVKTYMQTISELMFQKNIILNLILCSCSLYVSIKYMCIDKLNKRKKFTLTCSIGILIIHIFYNIFIYINNPNLFINIRFYLEGILNILYILSLIFIVLLCINDNERKYRMLFILGSIVLLAAPLLVVSPIGPRNFFMIYALFAILTTDFIEYILKGKNINIESCLLLIILGLLSFYFVIYGQMFIIDNKRKEKIKNYSNEKILSLPIIPHEEYLHGVNPYDKIFEERFKLFYNIDKEVNIEFIK